MEITVLYGGDSAEREVSLCSGAQVSAALKAAGHGVRLLDWRGEALSAPLTDALRAADAVFLALHGGAGEDGTLQRMLEAAGVFHYTGSEPLGAALAMDKKRAKQRVAACGVPIPRGCVLPPKKAEPPLPLPLVIKPRFGGSSVGLSFVHTPAQWEAFHPLGEMATDALCEEYLTGREFTVGILEDRALPVVEIRPIGGPYDYAHKYTAGASEELCPAPLSPQRAAHLQSLALAAFRALGLRDYGRVDFRENGRGDPRFLEANTLPGMTPTSLFPLAAQAAGMTFSFLCEQMVAMAAKRKNF